MFDRRNQDFHEISNRLTFNISDSAVVSSLPVSLFESDAVFWMVRFAFSFVIDFVQLLFLFAGG